MFLGKKRIRSWVKMNAMPCLILEVTSWSFGIETMVATRRSDRLVNSGYAVSKRKEPAVGEAFAIKSLGKGRWLFYTGFVFWQ